jgi:hypothetical protein
LAEIKRERRAGKGLDRGGVKESAGRFRPFPLSERHPS